VWHLLTLKSIKTIDWGVGVPSALLWLSELRKHTSDLSINLRLRSPRPIGITSAFRITYSLTYLQHANNTVSLLWSWNHKNRNMEHSGTSRNIPEQPEHRINMIMTKICKSKFSKIKWIKNKASARNMKIYFGGYGALGIHSTDHSECSLLFFPANCVTWFTANQHERFGRWMLQVVYCVFLLSLIPDFLNIWGVRRIIIHFCHYCSVVMLQLSSPVFTLSARNAWHFDPSSADSAFLEAR